MALIRASFLSTMKPLKEVIENIGRYSDQVMGQAGGSVPGDSPPDKTGLSARPETSAMDAGQTAGQAILHRSEQTVEEEVPEEAAADISGDIADSEDNEEAIEEISSVIPPVADVNLSSAWAKTLEKIDPPLASKISQSSVEFREDGLLLTLDGGHALFEEAIKKNLKSL